MSNEAESILESDSAGAGGASHANTQFASLGRYDQATIGPAMATMMSTLISCMQPLQPGTRVLDVGCGLGALAAEFARHGCNVVAIDLDEHNLQTARKAYPKVRFEVAAANHELLGVLKEDPFDIVTCTEVIEHVYSPKSLVEGCFSAVRPGGKFVISAPYHGYLKNLVIALLGKGDSHYNPLWEGHIKFFSPRMLERLLREVGFDNVRFKGAGRFPGLWMSSLMTCDRPR
jgi:ubiquinone/menaquinone biosynthesis C-methylase UbiE